MQLSQEKEKRALPRWMSADVPQFCFVPRGVRMPPFVFKIAGAPVLRRGLGLCQVLDYQTTSPLAGGFDKDARSPYDGRVLFQKFTSTEDWVVSKDECKVIVDKCFPKGKLHPSMTGKSSDLSRGDLQFLLSFFLFCRRAAEGEGFVVTSDLALKEKLAAQVKSRPAPPANKQQPSVPVPFDFLSERKEWIKGTFSDVPPGDLFMLQSKVDGKEKSTSYRKVAGFKAMNLSTNRHVELSPLREVDYRNRTPKPGVSLRRGPFSGVPEGHMFVDFLALRWTKGQGCFAWMMRETPAEGRDHRWFEPDEEVLYWQEEEGKA